MPLEICKKAELHRIKIWKKDFETTPLKGSFASQDTWFHGCKLHIIYSISRVFYSIDIIKSHLQDIQILKDIIEQLSDYVLFSD